MVAKCSRDAIIHASGLGETLARTSIELKSALDFVAPHLGGGITWMPSKHLTRFQNSDGNSVSTYAMTQGRQWAEISSLDHERRVQAAAPIIAMVARL